MYNEYRPWCKNINIFQLCVSLLERKYEKQKGAGELRPLYCTQPLSPRLLLGKQSVYCPSVCFSTGTVNSPFAPLYFDLSLYEKQCECYYKSVRQLRS